MRKLKGGSKEPPFLHKDRFSTPAGLGEGWACEGYPPLIHPSYLFLTGFTRSYPRGTWQPTTHEPPFSFLVNFMG